MEKRIENKLIMLKAILSFLQQNQSLWKDSAPLTSVYNELQQLVAQIEQTILLTNQSNSGLVVAKQNLQEALIEQTFELVSILFAYARRNNDEVLLAKVDFPISHLKNLRDNELASACTGVLNHGQSKAKALGEYGVTPEGLQSLEGLINKYVVQLPTRRITVSERKMANEKIKTLIAQAMLIASEQLDRLMLKFKNTEPDFYTSYLNARKVVDYGTRYEKPEGGTTPDEPAQ